MRARFATSILISFLALAACGAGGKGPDATDAAGDKGGTLDEETRDETEAPGDTEAAGDTDTLDTTAPGETEPAEVDGDGDGYTVGQGDCDDADPERFPTNPEECNLVDDDCSLEVDVDAAGADACARSESGEATQGALDLLLVIDDSCSMSPKQTRFAATVDELLPILAPTDLHAGIITTDMVDPGKSGMLQGHSGSLFLDESFSPADADAWLEAAILVGTGGAGLEQGLDATHRGLDGALTGAFNGGFLRPGADLAIVYVSDEPDFSKGTDVPTLDAFLQASFPAPATISVVAFAGGPTNCGADWGGHAKSYLELSALYGGLGGSICDADWQDDMITVASAILPDGAPIFVLAEVPDPATITITATEPDGAVVSPASPVDWAYDAALNAIVFAAYVPPQGTVLTIGYRAVP